MDEMEGFLKVRSYIDTIITWQETSRPPASKQEHETSLSQRDRMWREMPNLWSDAEKIALSQIAIAKTEPKQVRSYAMLLIVKAQLLQLIGAIVHVLDDPTDQMRGEAAVYLGECGRQALLPLYRTARNERAAGTIHDTWFGRWCIQSMHRILFAGYPVQDFNVRGLAWWEKTRPSEADVERWVRGENLPTDDGFGHPLRADI